jgi:hypothetical protein
MTKVNKLSLLFGGVQMTSEQTFSETMIVCKIISIKKVETNPWRTNYKAIILAFHVSFVTSISFRIVLVFVHFFL